nr:hypothetical protein [Tanacetum cinerariifolium]
IGAAPAIILHLHDEAVGLLLGADSQLAYACLRGQAVAHRVFYHRLQEQGGQDSSLRTGRDVVGHGQAVGEASLLDFEVQARKVQLLGQRYFLRITTI